MEINETIDSLIARAEGMFAQPFLPENAPWSHKVLFMCIMDTFGPIRGTEPEVLLGCRKALELLIPLVVELTRPRSIDDFLKMRTRLAQMVWRDRHQQIRADSEQTFQEAFDIREQYRPVYRDFLNEPDAQSWVMYYIGKILPALKILAYDEICALDKDTDPEETLRSFEGGSKRAYRPPEEKIIELCDLRKKLLTRSTVMAPQWQGYVIGKFRMPSHSGQRALFEAARKVVVNGSLWVAVESKKSILDRRRQEGKDIGKYVVEEDADRLRAIAALEAVDFVFLVDPSEDELRDPDAYFEKLHQDLPLDYWLVGEADYYLFKQFAKRCENVGAILLWLNEEASISTTDIVKGMQGLE